MKEELYNLAAEISQRYTDKINRLTDERNAIIKTILDWSQNEKETCNNN
jgi:phage host-nuclease inhibitor protein Gam